MSWHYLQAQAAAFSLADYLAGVQSPPAKSSPTPEPSCSTTRNSEISPTSPSGTTSAPSMESHSEATLTSLQEASPVRISRQLGKVPASQAPAPAYGLKCTESFAKYDPATHSWKTPQCSLLEDLDEYSETWPKSGIMLHGACWELPTAAPPTAGTESGFLHMIPTPTAHDAHKPHKSDLTARQGGRSLAASVMFPTPTCQDAKNNGGPAQQRRNTKPLNAVAGGALNPVWVEWLMGWPLGWTDLKHSATARFRSWRRQHSRYLNTD